MALKALMLRSSIDKKKSELKQLREKETEFQARQAEIETAIMEAKTEEEQRAVEEAVDKFDDDQKSYEEAIHALSEEIENLEKALDRLEEQKPVMEERAKRKKEERTKITMENINIRTLPMNQRAFDAIPMERRHSILLQEDTQGFLAQLRSMKGQQRGVNGAELTIPVVFLDLISENMYRYSKLLNRVRVRNVGGEARQTIAGTVPEAVWTEMCAAVNELTFVFNQVTLDGYKVAGFVPVCNSILEDNDINLASWIVEMLSESIGLAMDKAILYGKGSANKMPMGIVTRLAQSAKPSDYPNNAPEWVDLHTSNIKKIGGEGVTGAEFWAALTLAAGNTFTRYSRGEQFWAMNSKTYALLKSKVITFTATGDIAANIFGTLPVINGDIDILEFMPDGDIVGGYGDLYLLAVRSGMTIESSREVQFIQDNTVFKGKQRADGMPVVPGAFVAININNAEVTTTLDFAADQANDAQLDALTVGSETLSPVFKADTYSYSLSPSGTSAKIETVAAQAGAEIAIEYNGKPVRNGGTVTWTADSKAYPLTVTVKQGNAVRVYTISVTKAGA